MTGVTPGTDGTKWKLFIDNSAAMEAASAANTAAQNATAATGYIADTYDATKTYAVGDYVINGGKLYRCNTAITTAEEWTVAHWTETQVGDDVGELKTALENDIQDTARSPTLSALDALTEKRALDYTAIATQAAPLGWELGYIGPDGRQMGSSRYMRSLVIGGEILDNVDCITVTPPEDRFCWISVFNEDGSIDAQYGTYDEGHRYNGVPVIAPLKHGQWCRISLGRFNSDAGDYLTAAFIATIRCELRQIRERSRFAGKTLSLLGDSLSAFAEDIPEGNKPYYPNEHAGVTDRSQMWYNVLCDRLGMTPLVVNAWSGSCVTYGVRNDTTYLPASSPERCQALHSGTTMPDVILVAMGANDYSYMASESQFGSWDGTTPLGSEADMSDYATDTFRAAYATMLARIRKAYPDAQVVCITPWFIQRRATDTGVTYLNAIGRQESDYGDAIRDIARMMGCQVIDSGVAGFNRDNYYPTYCQDSSTTPAHPNAAGQARIGEAIALALTRGTNSPGGVDLVGQVRYDRGQALSAAQKATARGNMGLNFADSGDGEIVIS